MIKKPINILVLVIIMFSFSSCAVKTGKTGYVVPENNIKCIYYDDKDFKSSVKQAVQVKFDNKDIKGGIVPHHLLASGMIASFFKNISVQKYDDIIIVAPNHNRIGKSGINTAKEDWSTPFGVLKTEDAFVQKLADDGIADLNPELMEEEHSISSLVPYIKYYLPDSKIIPILLHGNLGLNNSINLGQMIAKRMEGKNYLVIASVDFSHYLTAEKADKMDEITLKAVEERDFKNISRMTNDNLDSPPSIITFLTLMNGNGADNYLVLGHDNSARISRQYSSSTTSYFTILFYKKI